MPHTILDGESTTAAQSQNTGAFSFDFNPTIASRTQTSLFTPALEQPFVTLFNDRGELIRVPDTPSPDEEAVELRKRIPLNEYQKF